MILGLFWVHELNDHISPSTVTEFQIQLDWAASNGNRYPPYPQVMATAISQ